jgi:hypothetical protein
MVVISLLGVVMAVVVIVRLRPGEGHGTLEEVLAAAASAVHTVPPVAAMSAAAGPEEAGPGEAVPEGSRERGSGTAVPRMPPASPPGP